MFTCTFIRSEAFSLLLEGRETIKNVAIGLLLFLFFYRLQPRLIISDLVSFSRLHHELAGVQEPSGPSPEPSLSDISEQSSTSETNILDPRRLRGRPSLSPCLPFVSIDRLREWIVPSKENVENDASAKPSRFAGYRGNYYLLSLLESSAQQAEVAKLYETLKSKQVVCDIS